MICLVELNDFMRTNKALILFRVLNVLSSSVFALPSQSITPSRNNTSPYIFACICIVTTIPLNTLCTSFPLPAHHRPVAFPHITSISVHANEQSCVVYVSVRVLSFSYQYQLVAGQRPITPLAPYDLSLQMYTLPIFSLFWRER